MARGRSGGSSRLVMFLQLLLIVLVATFAYTIFNKASTQAVDFFVTLIGIIFLVLAIGGVFALFLLMTKAPKRPERFETKREVPNQPIIYLVGGQQAPPVMAPPSHQITKKPTYDESNWKIIDDQKLETFIIGREDNQW